MAVPFDLGRLVVTGEPVSVVRGVDRSIAPNLWGDTASYSVSDERMLVYFPGSEITTQAARLAWVAPDGKWDALDLPAGQYSTPRVSPDGRWLAVERQDGARTDIWLYETSGSTALRRLTEGGNNRYPVWSRDGQRVAFQSQREGDAGIFWQRADGTGTVLSPNPGPARAG